MELTIRAADVRRTLYAAIVAMTAASAVGAAIELCGGPGLGSLGRILSVDAESSIPNWYSALALAVAAGLLAVIATEARRRRDRDALAWVSLCAIFALLSLDEIAAVHETAGARLGELVHAGGWFTFAWVIPALVLVPAVGATFLPFLSRLATRRRRQFVTAGAIFVTGALVMEMIGGKALSRFPKTTFYSPDQMMISPAYAVCFHIEEFCEMMGIAMFIAALVEHLAELPGSSGLTVRVRND